MKHAAAAAEPVLESSFERPPQNFLRPARALIGWLDPEQAHQLLVGGQSDPTIGPHVVALAQSARASAGTRKRIEQTDAVGAPPTGLSEHLSAFRKTAQNLFDDGFRICTVDLARIYAIQPTTFTDYRVEHFNALDPDNERGIAEVTLPTQTESQVSLAPDPAQKTVAVASPNLNLQIVGLQVEPAPDGCVISFKAAAPNSILQVGHFNGRYFCRDGHTRAVQLLKRGVNRVPAVVKDFASYVELAPRPTLFPEAISLGSNPPTLADFLDDRVSAQVLLPATRKAVIVSASEAEVVV
jgi:hypothetical protein